MEMFIQNEFRRCQNTGSFRMNCQRNPYQLIISYYNFTQRMTGNMEIKCREYNESNSARRLIIYIRAQIKISFKGKLYPIVKQVVFPPNFPLVPPIFSVINWDSKKYDVHEFYYHNILPDQSYEVKLNSAKHFKQNFDLELMYSEFASIVGEFFPFIYRPVKPMPSVPYYYDIRYNLPNGEFPVPGISKRSNSFNNNSHNNNESNEKDQVFDATNFNRNNSNNSNSNNSNMTGNMKIYFNQMIEDLEKDSNNLEKDGQSLIRKKERYQNNYRQMQELIVDMDSNKERVESKIDILKVKISKLEGEDINDENIEDFFEYSKGNGKELVAIENQLKALIETEYTMTEVFEERDEEPEKQLKNLNKLWKKERDMKLKKKYIIDNRLY